MTNETQKQVESEKDSSGLLAVLYDRLSLRKPKIPVLNIPHIADRSHNDSAEALSATFAKRFVTQYKRGFDPRYVTVQSYGIDGPTWMDFANGSNDYYSGRINEELRRLGINERKFVYFDKRMDIDDCRASILKGEGELSKDEFDEIENDDNKKLLYAGDASNTDLSEVLEDRLRQRGRCVATYARLDEDGGVYPEYLDYVIYRIEKSSGE